VEQFLMPVGRKCRHTLTTGLRVY